MAEADAAAVAAAEKLQQEQLEAVEAAQLSAVAALPKLEGKKAHWHLYIHKLRCWLPRELDEEEEKARIAAGEEATAEVVRPFLLLVYDTE